MIHVAILKDCLRFQLFFLFIAVVVIPALSIGAVDNVMEVVLRYLRRPIICVIVLLVLPQILYLSLGMHDVYIGRSRYITPGDILETVAREALTTPAPFFLRYLLQVAHGRRCHFHRKRQQWLQDQCVNS